jgi:GNAT superfamily N-acetyltransferase
MSAENTLEIVFEPLVAKRVARYVARSFFGPRELPQALARMLLTKEFGVFAGVPIALLLGAQLIPDRIFGWDGVMLAQALFWLAVLWLLAALARIGRYGRSSGIGCFAQDAGGARGALVGGLRMRLERGARRLWIAGLFVEPEARGAGIGTALVLAAFKLALRDAARGPVTVTVFAPSHPASKAMVARQLGGAQAVLVSQPLSEEARRTIERLETALGESAFTWALAETLLFR